MALTNEEVIWLNRDNSIKLQLYANSSASDLSAVTQIKLAFGSVTLDSTDASAGVIRWSQAGYETGEIRIIAGASTLLSTGRYNASLVVFDPSNTAGVVWDDDIPIRVKSDPLST
jgi:hypothetical protein